jgi:hypothetical protein
MDDGGIQVNKGTFMQLQTPLTAKCEAWAAANNARIAPQGWQRIEAASGTWEVVS